MRRRQDRDWARDASNGTRKAPVAHEEATEAVYQPREVNQQAYHFGHRRSCRAHRGAGQHASPHGWLPRITVNARPNDRRDAKQAVSPRGVQCFARLTSLGVVECLGVKKPRKLESNDSSFRATSKAVRPFGLPYKE